MYMLNSYKRFCFLKTIIKSEEIKRIARGSHIHSFTRNRKMTIEDIIIMSINKKGLTTSMEIYNYFKKKGKLDMKVSKQDYLKQRLNLNYEVFIALNQAYLCEYYNENTLNIKGYGLFAIDASKVEVPNSKENTFAFGIAKNGKQCTIVRSLISVVYDIVNGFCLDLQIGKVNASEPQQAKDNIQMLKRIYKDKCIIIFDRGYPGIEFYRYLEENNIKFIMRTSSNDYKKEKQDMLSNDEKVQLMHTYGRLAKIKQKHLEEYEKIKNDKYTEVRMIRCELKSGQIEYLVTNLDEKEFNTEEIIKMYGLRWGVEKKYHTLKNKMKLECVTGTKPIYVYQDFHAQLLTYNIVHDMMRDAQKNIEEKETGKGEKIRINENIAIGLFKEEFIEIMMIKSNQQKEKKLNRLYEEMIRYVNTVRAHNKNTPRNFRLSNKNRSNLKNSF